ncbi:protealysin inhibitor emfourin [Pseudarthrobacter sp. H2]|uniref:protealysin inhibitor emfourin n=1 Tax=Pseudarthrobacter sp. H2 TaxID=3418415 RepID=UPI003CF3F9E9
MKITVERSGGFAGMTRTWAVQTAPPDDNDCWQPLIEACPWDTLPPPGRAVSPGQADRFTYSIRAGQRRATLPEQALTGPWRDLVEHAKAAAESARAPGGWPDNPPSDTTEAGPAQ